MDINTFAVLVADSEDTLYRVSMSMLKNEHDAMDAVHNAVLKAYENLHKLKNDEYFKTWLTRILINECKLEIRKQKRYVYLEDDTFDISSRDNPYRDIEIGEVIDGLPPKIRLVVVMYYVEGYSIKDIKMALKIPEGTVKSRLSKGRKILKEKLG